jgi:hypothetical protein
MAPSGASSNSSASASSSAASASSSLSTSNDRPASPSVDATATASASSASAPSNNRPPSPAPSVDAASTGSGKANKKKKKKNKNKNKNPVGRPPKWHSVANKQIIVSEANLLQYGINRAIDSNDPKAHAQTQLLNRIMAALGRHCDWNTDNLLDEKNPLGTPSDIEDVALMRGQERADELERRSDFLSDNRQVRQLTFVPCQRD